MANEPIDTESLKDGQAPVLTQTPSGDDLSMRSERAAPTCGMVTDIQRFSLHDGPGIRTTVFFKGCSLRCFWCHNPECITASPEIQVFSERCIGCGVCVDVCEHEALALREGKLDYRREQCVTCGKCTEVCCARARVLVGMQMTVDEVIKELLQDVAFYERSGGGVTISGGEPVLQRDFCRAILEQLKHEGIHTALETAGNYPWQWLAELLLTTDLVMMDIKHLSAQKHRQATGASNEQILDNARRLAQTDIPVVFRIPVVPSVNETPDEIRAIAMFIRDLASLRQQNKPTTRQTDISLELLPYHPLATDKYRGLSRAYRGAELAAPSKQTMSELTLVAEACGVTIQGAQV